jgi:hypothetical protein
VVDRTDQFIQMVSEAMTKIDDMHTFANISTAQYLKFATIDDQYYRIKIERITKTEFER